MLKQHPFDMKKLTSQGHFKTMGGMGNQNMKYTLDGNIGQLPKASPLIKSHSDFPGGIELTTFTSQRSRATG